MGTGDEANAGIEFSSDFGGVLANMHKYIFFFFFEFIFFSSWRHFKKGCVALSTVDGHQTKTSWHPLPIKSFISTQ